MRMRTLSFSRTIERVDAGEDAAVPAPQVEVQHRHDLGRVAARVDVVGVEQKAEVPVHLIDQRVLGFGMRDPEAHHAHGHLRHLIRVRVIHEGAGTACDKLIDKGLAW
jgi:hypothetical protein